MSMRDDGGPAFPVEGVSGGMSLRDYFAAQVLPAVVAAYVEANGRCMGADHAKYNCVAHAYEFADTMIRERAK